MKSRYVGDEFIILGDQRCFVVEIGEVSELGMPAVPIVLRSKKVVPNIAEKFRFHNMDLLQWYSRDIGPCLVGVAIVVQDYESWSTPVECIIVQMTITHFCFLALEQ